MSRQIIRYSHAFKLKVIKEIESGKYTIGDAKRIYDIKGAETIQNWIRKLGRIHLLNSIIRIQMKDEKDKVKELQNRIKALERALTDTQIDNLCMKSLIEVIDEKYGIDSKKNFGSKLPPELQDTLKKLK